MSQTKTKPVPHSKNRHTMHAQNKPDWEALCLKAGLKKALWDFFDKHGHKSLQSLYAHREDYITLYTSVFFDTDALQKEDRAFWNSANNQQFPQKFSTFPHIILSGPNTQYNRPSGAYKIKIRLIDLHQHLDRNYKLQDHYCLSKFSIKPEHVESLIKQDNTIIENPFYALGQSHQGVKPDFSSSSF